MIFYPIWNNVKKKKKKKKEKKKKKRQIINLGGGYIGTKQHRVNRLVKLILGGSAIVEWVGWNTQHNITCLMGTFLLCSNYLFFHFFFRHFLSPLTQILWKQALNNMLKKSVLKVSHVYTTERSLARTFAARPDSCILGTFTKDKMQHSHS